jgi:DNA-binding IclR family transcriptional regulator
MPKSNIYYIEVVGKALAVMDVFVEARKPSLSLRDLAQATHLNKNTVFRVLHTLTEHGYLTKHEHEYTLGTKLTRLTQGQFRHKGLLEVCGPFLDALRDEFQETVNLGVLEGGQIRYADVRESPHRFRLAERVGGSDHLHCTALGKAWMAHLPFEKVRLLLKENRMQKQTQRTITTLSAMKAELERVRSCGYAEDDEESMAGAYCVGAPILDREGSPVAAISISGPTVRFARGHAGRAIAELLDAISLIRIEMGYEPKR